MELLHAANGCHCAFCAYVDCVGPTEVSINHGMCTCAGLSGGLKPWEGAPVLIDGSCQPLGIGTHPFDLPSSHYYSLASTSGRKHSRYGFGNNSGLQTVFGNAGVALTASSTWQQGADTMHTAGQSSSNQALQDKVTLLEKQLAQSQETCADWQRLHGELHQYCLDNLLPGVSAGGVK